MHFITESELRITYRNAPFQEFTLKPEERLTPEGKQFLIDKKIRLIEAQALENGLETVGETPLPEFLFYKEWLSCELYEAAILAMDYSVTMSQELLQLAQEVNEGLTKEVNETKVVCDKTDFGSEAFELEAVHLFSRYGKLLIKFKKIEEFIRLIHTKYPQCHGVLQRINTQLNEFRKQLVGAGQ
ncbi:hypothetical protein IGI37_003302 [Enterococcus sp. AZ194]|uniref:hypothetical protein n=1 Tax=Enterococcus sp. AZ194 TaxID=2774629 RepID=UPI003F29E170